MMLRSAGRDVASLPLRPSRSSPPRWPLRPLRTRPQSSRSSTPCSRSGTSTVATDPSLGRRHRSWRCLQPAASLDGRGRRPSLGSGCARTTAIVSGAARSELTALDPARIEDVAWSGGRPHLENIATQLQRVATGEVEYLVVRADGHAVSKGGIDVAKEPGTGTIWQVTTHLIWRVSASPRASSTNWSHGRSGEARTGSGSPSSSTTPERNGSTSASATAPWRVRRIMGSRGGRRLAVLYTTKLTEMVKVV